MSKRQFKKKPLYRKVNTRARGVFHHSGPDFRHQRNTKAELLLEATETARGKMKLGVQRGLDYTPLVRFLQSRVGQPFAEVHSEAVSRLDREEPIFWFVSRNLENAKPIVRCGESSFYSGLYVDDSGVLQLVDSQIDIHELWPECSCCTHTLNGEVFPNRYAPDRRYSMLEERA